jgi:hypothetical protein
LSGIFISYRKEDTRPWAINLRDHLARTFGERQVFLDVDSMDAGKWRTQIDGALDRCAVVLVLIGPRWTAAPGVNGRNRLFLPDDVHRLEVATALKRPDVTVIPVLVDGARIPLASELPEDLHGLLECQVREIGDSRERRVAELDRLTRTVDELTGQRRQRRRAATAVGAIITVGVVNTIITSSSPVVAVGFLVIAAGLALFSWRVYRRMAREHMKGAWVAIVAVILSAAVLTGSIVRLAARMTQPAQTSWNREG